MDNNEFVAMIKDLKELREIRDAANFAVITEGKKANIATDLSKFGV